VYCAKMGAEKSSPIQKINMRLFVIVSVLCYLFAYKFLH
jgi:hypothetical protein